MKFKRWNLYTILLSLWALGCAWIGREDLFIPGRRLRYIIILLLEAACIVGMRYFIKRKEEMKKKREELDKNTDDIIHK